MYTKYKQNNAINIRTTHTHAHFLWHKVLLTGWKAHGAVHAFVTDSFPCRVRRYTAWAFRTEFSDHRNGLAQVENCVIKPIGDVQHLTGLLDTLVAVGAPPLLELGCPVHCRQKVGVRVIDARRFGHFPKSPD